MNKRIISLILCFSLVGQQTGLAQVVGQLDVAGHLKQLTNNILPQDQFRPIHLRYLEYNPDEENFRILLDKGDFPLPKTRSLAIEEETQKLMRYFQIGLRLPNSTFWVNLRADAPDNIIEDKLAQTDLGRIMLEADVQLKKDTAAFTSPDTPEGREYWDKLYQKAGELFGSEQVEIPTYTRPWIVPGEIILRETRGDGRGKRDEGRGKNDARTTQPSAYIYKATLKVMLEEDYIANVGAGSKPALLQGRAGLEPAPTIDGQADPRYKALNEYSSELIRQLVIPKISLAVNRAKRYAALRQVYYSLILAQWFKDRNRPVVRRPYSVVRPASVLPPPSSLERIDSGHLSGLTSKEAWSKSTYFSAYQKSFKEGEYRKQEKVYTPTGAVIRNYVSGGEMLALARIPGIGQARISGETVVCLPAASAVTVNTELMEKAIIKINDAGKAQTVSSPSFLPSENELEQILALEKCHLIFTDTQAGKRLLGYLYLVDMRNALRFCYETKATIFTCAALMSFLERGLNWTEEDIREKLKIPYGIKYVIFVNEGGQNSMNEVYLEELFHLWAGDVQIFSDEGVASFEKLAATEIVNDFLQLLFYPLEEVDKFKSTYVDWNSRQKRALLLKYRGRYVKYARSHVREIMVKLKKDLESNVKIAIDGRSIPLAELLGKSEYTKSIDFKTIPFVPYLQGFLDVERFSQNKPIFETVRENFSTSVEVTPPLPAASNAAENPSSLKEPGRIEKNIIVTGVDKVSSSALVAKTLEYSQRSQDSIRISPEQLESLVHKYGDILHAKVEDVEPVCGIQSGFVLNFYKPTLVRPKGMVRDNGAFYCNYIIFWDKKPSGNISAVFFHTGNAYDRKLAVESLDYALRELGAEGRPQDIAAMIFHSNEKELDEEGWSAKIEGMYQEEIKRKGIYLLAVDRNLAWSQTEVAFLADEGIFMAFGSQGRITHLVDMQALLGQKEAGAIVEPTGAKNVSGSPVWLTLQCASFDQATALESTGVKFAPPYSGFFNPDGTHAFFAQVGVVVPLPENLETRNKIQGVLDDIKGLIDSGKMYVPASIGNVHVTVSAGQAQAGYCANEEHSAVYLSKMKAYVNDVLSPFFKGLGAFSIRLTGLTINSRNGRINFNGKIDSNMAKEKLFQFFSMNLNMYKADISLQEISRVIAYVRKNQIQDYGEFRVTRIPITLNPNSVVYKDGFLLGEYDLEADVFVWNQQYFDGNGEYKGSLPEDLFIDDESKDALLAIGDPEGVGSPVAKDADKGEALSIVDYFRLTENEKADMKKKFLREFSNPPRIPMPDYAYPLTQDERMRELVASAGELSKTYPDCKIVSFGRSPLWVVETARLLESFGKGTSQAGFSQADRFGYVAFSKNWLGGADTKYGEKLIREFISLGMYPNENQVAKYRDYLLKIGLDPLSIINRKEKTVFVEYIKSGSTLAAFLQLLGNWFKELNVSDQFDGKIIIHILHPAGQEIKIREIMRFTLVYQTIDPELIEGLANSDPFNDSLGIHFAYWQWDTIDPLRAKISGNANLVKFRIIDFLVREGFVDSGDYLRTSATSSPTAGQSLGGIDLRFMPIFTQASSNLSLSGSRAGFELLSELNFDLEWRDIDAMLIHGLSPSAERVKEYVQACCVKDVLAGKKDQIVSGISNVLRLDEENNRPSDPILTDILVVLESGASALELRDIFLGRSMAEG